MTVGWNILVLRINFQFLNLAFKILCDPDLVYFSGQDWAVLLLLSLIILVPPRLIFFERKDCALYIFLYFVQALESSLKC